MGAERGRYCAFCGGKPVTKEHVWPGWLTEVLRGPFVQNQLQTRVSTPEGDTLKAWNTDRLDVTAKQFCKGCNSGWMGRLEESAKPILKPMILAQGLPLSLGPSEQEVLARWAYKTALAADFHIRGISTNPGDGIPSSRYKQFFKSGLPQRQSLRIWTIPLAETEYAVWGSRTVHEFEFKPIRLGNKTIPATRSSLYVTTLAIGFVVFQICGQLRGIKPVPFFDGAQVPALLQLFPRVADNVTWPAVGMAGLRKDQLRIFSDRRDFLG